MKDYEIILDKERKLRYSNRSCMELEKRIGKSIFSVFTDAGQEKNSALQQKKLMDQFSTSQFITDFIYCGLLHENITYDEVVDIIPIKKYLDIINLAMIILPEEFGLTAKAEGKKKAK